MLNYDLRGKQTDIGRPCATHLHVHRYARIYEVDAKKI